jgi:4-hydroxy-tetrahydrodipicolinate synthase
MRDVFRGSHVALPTPFRGRDAELLDLDALRGLVDLHAHSTTSGVVVAGTTGEASTLTDDEYRDVLRTAVRAAAGRVQVIAGVGTNATRTTLERARVAEEAGVDGLLVVTPYYNRPGPRGLLLHFATLAEAVSTPIVLYNVPSRTGVDLTPDIVGELARRFEHVVAIKQAAPSIARVQELVALGTVAVLCGEDALLAEFVRAGAVGAIGVTSNLVPERFARWIDAAANGPETRLVELSRVLVPLATALFVEPNPVPVKAALAVLGHCEESVRLPLTTLEPESRRALTNALFDADLARPAPATPTVASVRA